MMLPAVNGGASGDHGKKRSFLPWSILIIGALSSIAVFFLVSQNIKQHILERVVTISLLIDSKAVTALSGSAEDVTNLQYVQLKTLLSEVRAVNPDTRFLYITGENSEHREFFYVDSEPPESKDYSAPGDWYDDASPATHKLFADGQSRVDHINRDQWGVWISGLAPIRDANGTTIALMGMDVSAYGYIATLALYTSAPLVLALLLALLLFGQERARRRKEEELERKSEFLSIASHEIRTPVIGIEWALSTLLSTSAVEHDSKTHEIISLAHAASVSTVARINNLLQANKSELNQEKDTTEPVELREIFGAIRTALLLPARSRGIEIQVLDEVKKFPMLSSNRDSLYQIFFNLIGNAVKYANANSEITVSLYAVKDTVVVDIKDVGKGISAEDQLHIFDGYHRTKDAQKSHQAGTGLGLFMVKKLAASTGASVSVQSKIGEGSIFSVTIPHSVS
jgi:signal transduction histidine kinase